MQRSCSLKGNSIFKSYTLSLLPYNDSLVYIALLRTFQRTVFNIRGIFLKSIKIKCTKPYKVGGFHDKLDLPLMTDNMLSEYEKGYICFILEHIKLKCKTSYLECKFDDKITIFTTDEMEDFIGQQIDYVESSLYFSSSLFNECNKHNIKDGLVDEKFAWEQYIFDQLNLSIIK